LEPHLKKIITILALLSALIIGLYLWTGDAKKSNASLVTIDKTEGYKLLVDGKPFQIRGVCYSPIPVGKDYEYNFWGDPAKPWLADGKLMKEMGANTIRLYRMGKNPDEVRQVLDDMHRKFGMHVLVGTYLGFWNWPPPNYADDEFKDKVRKDTLEMVRLYKDHPAVLMWVLGNENNYSFDRNVQRWSSPEIDAIKDVEGQRREKARLYYSFVNSLAKDIKAIDPKHPVALGVGETSSLELAKTVSPDIDVIAMIAYRGSGFGNLFRQVKQKFDLPVVMTEWGADSFNAATREADESNQAEFLKNQWKEIERNMDAKRGVGNALGGTLFEWTDEWWKGNENLPHTWGIHDEAGHWQNASYFYDANGADKMNMNEEWWGIVSLDTKNNAQGYQDRIPKKAYNVLKNLWTAKPSVKTKKA
jgi:beta-galactosidase/beta-glucuronidase